MTTVVLIVGVALVGVDLGFQLGAECAKISTSKEIIKELTRSYRSGATLKQALSTILEEDVDTYLARTKKEA